MSASHGPGPKVALVTTIVLFSVALIDVLLFDNDVTPTTVVIVVFLYHLCWNAFQHWMGGERT